MKYADFPHFDSTDKLEGYLKGKLKPEKADSTKIKTPEVRAIPAEYDFPYTWVLNEDGTGSPGTTDTQEKIADALIKAKTIKTGDPRPDNLSKINKAEIPERKNSQALEPQTKIPPSSENRPRYLVKKKALKLGGMSQIYEALDLRTMLPVVIKSGNRDSYSPNAVYEDEFKKEARIMMETGSRNPNIVRILEYLVTSGGPMLIMERMDPKVQPTLRDLIAEKGNLNPKMVSTILLDIAGACDSMWKNGILHYDLKPDNVFYDEQSGHPLVTDFGLSVELNHINPEVIGTPAWISPERTTHVHEIGIVQVHEIGIESEVFSLGLISFYLITGNKLFYSVDPYKIMNDIQNEDTREAVKTEITAALQKQNANETVINSVVAVINKSLEKIASDRYPTATAFAQDLENAFQGKTIEAKIKAIPAAEAPFEFKPKESAFGALVSRFRGQFSRK